VLDDQRPTEWGPGPGPGLCGVGSTANRQVEGEGRAVVRFRFNRDCAADLLGEPEHLAEPKTGSLAEPLGGEEGLEDPFHHVWGNTAPRIRHRQRNMLALEVVGS